MDGNLFPLEKFLLFQVDLCITELLAKPYKVSLDLSLYLHCWEVSQWVMVQEKEP